MHWKQCRLNVSQGPVAKSTGPFFSNFQNWWPKKRSSNLDGSFSIGHPKCGGLWATAPFAPKVDTAPIGKHSRWEMNVTILSLPMPIKTSWYHSSTKFSEIQNICCALKRANLILLNVQTMIDRYDRKANKINTKNRIHSPMNVHE